MMNTIKNAIEAVKKNYDDGNMSEAAFFDALYILHIAEETL